MLQPVTTSPFGGFERGADLEPGEARARVLAGVDRRGDQRGVVIVAGGGDLERDRLPGGLVAAVAGAALGDAPLLVAAAIAFGAALVDETPIGAAAPIVGRPAILLPAAIAESSPCRQSPAMIPSSSAANAPLTCCATSMTSE